MEVRLDFIFSTLMMAFAFVEGDWTTNCPNSCKCIWSDGKKTAECQDAGFSAVPGTLSPELQIINLNHNNLHSLPSQTFKSVNLFHLHKIYTRNCSIELIDKNALSGMVVLIEIDLSHNNIRTLHSDLFRECEKIREVRLSNNPIQKLEDGLFSNLEFLQTVDFTGCHLHEIGSQVFWNVPALTTLELKGNRFTHLQLSAVEHLHKLKNFGLTDNPWNCDCKLRPLRNWVVKRNLYSIPTGCREPLQIKDTLWNEVTDPDQFACKPRVVSLTREPRGILACLVEGDPLPTVTWTFNNKLVTNYSFLASDFVVQESLLQNGGKWSNLTLRNTRGKDNGEYKCIAKSYGGQAELGKEVKFDPYATGNSYYGSSDGSYDNWLLLAGSIIGALLLILIVLFVKCYVCKRRGTGQRCKKDKESVNGSVTHVIDSEEKTLINVINPLQKPPRTVNTSANSSETEFHESNMSQYNENGSIKDDEYGGEVEDEEGVSVIKTGMVKCRLSGEINMIDVVVQSGVVSAK
ncbi:hypothetical protein RUM44_008253 [Polyplax serrata]|uniref:Ig-like domain-containing protein n=1 Tax=Polyplax serrata TaxID=468196 RepID=A0ABR1B7X8_POLSC